MATTSRSLRPGRTLRPLGDDRRNEEGGTFRVVIGDLLEEGPPGCDCDGCRTEWIEGDPVCDHKPLPHNARRCRCGAHLKGGGNHRYSARQPGDPADYTGDVITSKRNLVARLNTPVSQKVVRLDRRDVEPQHLPPPEPYPLDRMTVPQLIAHAEDEKIDLKAAKSKEEMLRIIRAVAKA